MDDTEKLSLGRKLAFAFGEVGYTLGPGTVIAFWYTFFLTDVARLRLPLVSLFWFVVTLWDAVNDPLFGFLSDRTRTRWGRRRPFLLFGALPLGAIFVLLWIVPPFESQTMLFIYYTLVYIMFETAFTAVSCPYIALTPEMTLDHDERTSLVTYRGAFNIAASLIAPIVFGLLIFPMFPKRDPQAFWLVGLICGISSVPPFIVAFFAARERPEFQEESAPPLLESLRHVRANVVFRYTLIIRILSWMPVVIAQAAFAYFLMYWAGMNEEQTSITQAIILLVALLSLPIILGLAKRFEKKTAYIIAASTWAVVMLAILLVPQGSKTPAYIIAGLAGFGVAAAQVIPRSMDTDVLEVDEVKSGHRQEGAYTGVTVFVDKLARSIVLFLVPAILSWTGYVQPSEANPDPVQPMAAMTALRVLISVGPAILLGASVIVASRYPITRKRHARLLRRLQERRLRRKQAKEIIQSEASHTAA